MHNQEPSHTPKTDATLAVSSRLRPVEPSAGFVPSVMQRVAAHAAGEHRAGNYSRYAHSRRLGGHVIRGVFAVEPRFAVAALALACMCNMILFLITFSANIPFTNEHYVDVHNAQSAKLQSLQGVGSAADSQTNTTQIGTPTARAAMQSVAQYYGIAGVDDASAEAWYE